MEHNAEWIPLTRVNHMDVENVKRVPIFTRKDAWLMSCGRITIKPYSTPKKRRQAIAVHVFGRKMNAEELFPKKHRKMRKDARRKRKGIDYGE